MTFPLPCPLLNSGKDPFVKRWEMLVVSVTSRSLNHAVQWVFRTKLLLLYYSPSRYLRRISLEGIIIKNAVLIVFF